MALRAGYYGLKMSVKRTLEKLAQDASGMKIIKSFGDGLNLTQAGKLNMTAATASKIGGVKVGEGLDINDGVLSVTVTGGTDYSETEVDTGIKWIDGKTIYAKSYFKDSSIPATNTSFDTIADLDNLIDAKGSVTIGTNTLSISFKASSSGCFPQIMSGGNVTLSYTGTISKFNLTIYYTKTEQEE